MTREQEKAMFAKRNQGNPRSSIMPDFVAVKTKKGITIFDVPKNKGNKNIPDLSDRQKQNRFYEREVIDSISSEGFDVKEPKTDKEKLQFLKDTFRSEFGFQIERIGERKAFEEWISGLPSSFNIEFTNVGILKLAKKSGSLPQDATEKQEARVLENYFNFITVKTFQAFNKFKVK